MAEVVNTEIKIEEETEQKIPESAEEEQPSENNEQLQSGEGENDDKEVEFIRDPILDSEEMKKVFVGNIPIDSTNQELKEFFESICNTTIEEPAVIRKDTDKKSHFGFVIFPTSDVVDELLLKRDQLIFKSRQLEVNRAVPKNNTSAGAHQKNKKLFIANLPTENCSEEELEKYFQLRHPEKYGKVESVQLIKKKDEQGNKLEQNKGFGFIVVSSEDMADKMAIQHATFEFKGRKIELKKSVPNPEGKSRRGRGGGPNHHPYNPYGGYGYGGYGYGGYGSWVPGFDQSQGYDYFNYGYGPQQQQQQGGRRGGRFKPY